MGVLAERGLELLRRASTDLPADVESALERARLSLPENSTARSVLNDILANVAMSRDGGSPLCQDTGLVNFWVKLPSWVGRDEVVAEMTHAVSEATTRGFLRPNAVDAISGRNSGDNVGIGLPHFEFETADDDNLVIDVLLKGGGSENAGAQYRLPDSRIGAGRDLKGVARAVLDAVHQAQGSGCAPGLIGVCIGGDRTGSYAEAKRQLLRTIDDENPDPVLRELEKSLFDKINRLEIGPMGFGGAPTVIGVKIGAIHRHPACYFVSIAYGCWANRHRRMTVWDDDFRIE